MQVSPSQQVAPDPSATNGHGTSLTTDYETFLQMLTVQMTNQDPLNPVDSSDYAVQLATFSSVEQQVQTNDLLMTIIEQLMAMNVSQMAGWVGMDAQALAPGYFDGNPVETVLYPDPAADSVDFVVKNQDGEVVYRSTIDPEQENLSWDGTNLEGEVVPEGLYTFYTESFAEGTSLGFQEADVYSRIIEARATETGVVLVLEGGATVSAAEITALRAPDGSVTQDLPPDLN